MRQENNKTPMCPLHQILTFSIFNILLYLLFIHVFILFLQIYGVTITINNIENHFAYFEIFIKGIRQHASFCNLYDLDTVRGICIDICSSCSFTLTAALYSVIRIHHDLSILLWFRFFHCYKQCWVSIPVYSLLCICIMITLGNMPVNKIVGSKDLPLSSARFCQIALEKRLYQFTYLKV